MVRLVGAGASAALCLAMVSVPLPASADVSTPPSSSKVSPSTAADAPWTKTVSYLVSQLTPAEEVAVIEGADVQPDPHGQVGYLDGVPRVGIPATRNANALGIDVFADATAFPSRIGLASSFDRSAYSTLGETVGKEGLALGIDLIYGPQVDLSRYPSWARNVTTNGEDAYVSSEFTAAEINGIQSQGLMSEVKHVSMYNGQDQDTPSLVSSQAAHEVFLKPVQSAIQDGGVSSLMCSYATFRIVGEQTTPQYSCQNSNLQKNIVKGQFGLKGFITSDYHGSHATSDILQGMDNEFASTNLSAEILIPLIDVTSSSYDPDYATATANSVARMVYQYERFGLLDNSKIPSAYQSDVPQHGNVASTYNGTTVNKAAGSAVALKLAEKSGVLLKNEGNALPLSTSDTVAAVGPAGTLMPAAPGGERAIGYGDRTTYTPVKAMKAAAGSSKVISAPGIDWIGTTVPSAALKQNAGGSLAGLTRTTVTNDVTPVTTTSIDTTVAGTQTNLVKGYKYTWTGYLNVATADTYQLLLQRPSGTDSGVASAFNGGVSPGSAGTVSLAIDGAKKTLQAPTAVLQRNGFPDGKLASNGQYLGKDNTGTSVALTAGLHQITFTYNPSVTSAQTPTLRFAWAPLAANTAAAVSAAQTSNKTVIFVNSERAGPGPRRSPSEGLAVIPQAQVDLLNTVAAAAHDAGHKVAVVMNTGSAVAMPWADKVDAILEMWNPGQEGGTATSNLLYGKVSPSGKLPITFPVDDNHTAFTDSLERTTATTIGSDPSSFKWTEGVNVGYRWYTDPTANTKNYEPQYAFGHGLSYTSFGYSDLSVKNAAGGGLNVTFTVKNTGSKAAADAPQIYLGASPDLAAPVLDANGLVVSGFQQSAQKLVQFDHIQLAAGESKTETVHVDLQDVSAWDTPSQAWVVGTGNRAVSLAHSSRIGQSADDITKTVNVISNAEAPKVTTQLTASQTVLSGSTVTLTAHASGTPAAEVIWQKSTDGGTTWNDMEGATSDSLVLTATQSARYRAVFSNELGMTTTDEATVTVHLDTKVAASAKKTISHKHHAYVKVTIKPAGQPTGKVVVHYGSRTRTVAVVASNNGHVRVMLPKLKKGKYRVYVTYSGDATYSSGTSPTFTIKSK